MIDLNKKEYCLYNRYGNKNYLTPTNEEGLYKLNTENSEYLQISYDKDKDGNVKYYSVDPDGGPFISLETKSIPLADKTILSVEIKEIKEIDGEFFLLINIL